MTAPRRVPSVPRDRAPSRGRSATLAVALILAPLLVACGAATATAPASVLLAQRRWAERGPADYRMTVTRSCECLPSMTGPVVVTVHDGVVTARHYAATGAPVPPELADAFPSVNGLFARIAGARRQGAARIDVVYDPRFGHPVDIDIDVDVQVADEEIVYAVRDLTPL